MDKLNLSILLKKIYGETTIMPMQGMQHFPKVVEGHYNTFLGRYSDLCQLSRLPVSYEIYHGQKIWCNQLGESLSMI